MEAAESLRRDGHYNLVCFLAQQAAEKGVKAFLYDRGAEDPWGHAVCDLMSDAASYDESLAALRTTGAALDKFYIPTRYPNGLPGGLPAEAFTEEEAGRALEMADQILGEVRRRIGS